MQVTGHDIRMTMGASTLIGDKVYNRAGEHLGKIEEFMLDLQQGCVSYAVLSFGGVLGMGDKLFAIPWQAFTLDEDKRAFVLDVPREKLDNAPGFDKNAWPDMSQPEFSEQIHGHYGTTPMTGGPTGTGMGGTRGGSMGGTRGY